MGSLAVIKSNIANVYIDSNSDSELDNQLIIGEAVDIINRTDKWLEITCIRDSSRGWIRSYHVNETNQIYPANKEKVIVGSLISDIYSKPDLNADIITKTTLGAVLQKTGEVEDFTQIKMPCGRIGYICSNTCYNESRLPVISTVSESIISLSKKFVGVPYLWGGRTPFGIDCSGFIQLIHLSFGIMLPRNSYVQAQSNNTIYVAKEDIQAGDLVFFSKDGSRVCHVGMAVSKDDFIHSCGAAGVIVTSFSHTYYNEIYFSARRLIV